MSDTVLAAIYGAAATILAAVVGVFREDIAAFFVKSRRRPSGVWTGEAKQVPFPDGD
jgi:hypothetical protein